MRGGMGDNGGDKDTFVICYSIKKKRKNKNPLRTGSNVFGLEK